MRLYSFKYPIDFVKLSNNELKLIHTNVELTSENIPKYQTWRNNIYDIFSKDSSGNITPYTIINKLKKYIDNAYNSDEDLEFIECNQWLLRFATNDLRSKLINSNLFNVEKDYIDIPVDYYELNGKGNIVYSKELVPVWEIPMRKECNKLISWILSENGNSIADKLSSLSLSQTQFIKNTIRSNTWLLMLIDEQKRVTICQNLNIPVRQVQNYYTARKREEKGWYVDYKLEYMPMDQTFKHSLDSRKIQNIFLVENIYLSLYNMCYEKSNISFIAHNMWLLDLLNENEKNSILFLMGDKSFTSDAYEDEKDLTIDTRKVISISPKEGKDGIYSTQLEVPLYIYKEVKELNATLYGIVGGTIDLSVEDFISSSPLVLEYWPWLTEYHKYINKKR